MTSVISQHLRVDHVVTVYRDLDSAIQYYQDAGFTVRLGTKHTNGIVNAFIDFSNRAELEIISIVGSANDDLAEHYVNLIQQQEGGVYVCLTGISTSAMIDLIANRNIQYDVIKSKEWNYITFPEDTGYSQFFFIDYHSDNVNSTVIAEHQNGLSNMSKVIVEGDQRTSEFLKSLKMEPTLDESVFQTENCGIVIIPKKSTRKNHIINSVEFCNIDKTSCLLFDLIRK